MQFIAGKYSEALKVWCADLVSALLTLHFRFRIPLCARATKSTVCGEGRKVLTVEQKSKNFIVGSVPFQGLY